MAWVGLAAVRAADIATTSVHKNSVALEAIHRFVGFTHELREESAYFNYYYYYCYYLGLLLTTTTTTTNNYYYHYYYYYLLLLLLLLTTTALVVVGSATNACVLFSILRLAFPQSERGPFSGELLQEPSLQYEASRAVVNACAVAAVKTVL